MPGIYKDKQEDWKINTLLWLVKCILLVICIINIFLGLDGTESGSFILSLNWFVVGFSGTSFIAILTIERIIVELK